MVAHALIEYLATGNPKKAIGYKRGNARFGSSSTVGFDPELE